MILKPVRYEIYKNDVDDDSEFLWSAESPCGDNMLETHGPTPAVALERLEEYILSELRKETNRAN